MKKSIYKTIIPASVLILIPFISAVALEVDVDEIRTERVKFINYSGEKKKGSPKREIEAIGKKLSKKSKTGVSSYHKKYSIIRAVSENEPDKFSAEIFSIGRDAKADHIETLRRILGSYLMDRYHYSRKEARAVSVFLSYYNAVHRGDMDYFKSKYKGAVIGNITEKNAGISTKYYDWPGATRMLIPLTEKAQKGKLDSVDPDELSDKDTKDQVRKDDKNLKERKDMTDLRERKLDKDKEELKKKKKKQDEARKGIDKKKEEIKKKEKVIRKDKEESKKIKDPDKRAEKERDIGRKEKKLEEEKKAAEKRDEKSREEEKGIAEEKEKQDARKKDIEKEKEDVKKDEIKRDIKKDPEEARKKLEEKEKDLDRREDKLRNRELEKNIYAGKLYYLKIREYLEGGHYNNDLVMINAATRKVMFQSPVENICGSRYDIHSGGIVIITHKGSHTSGHRLTLVDKDTLKAKTYGGDNIFWRSFIEIRDGYIYALVNDNGRYYLGRFDGSLKLAAKSKVELSEDTFISFFDSFIYINRRDKSIIVLNKEDLAFIGDVQP
jgi:hypothetical protein